MTPTASPSWFEHVDLMQLSLVAAMGLIVFFAKRTLQGFENSQKLLFKKYDTLREDHDQLHREFYELRGEHNASHGIKK